MKKTIRIIIFGLLLLINLPVSAQVKKLVSEINSVGTKETITFKYNNKNQLVYFDEKGVVTYREFTFKYDKTNGRLTECITNEDKGELISSAKYDYSNPDYIREEVKTSGKKIHSKTTDYNDIHIDDKNRLIKTMFNDEKLWEEFVYDEKDNIITYTIYAASGKSNTSTTYKFSTQNPVFLNIDNLPLWFLALHLNNMKWSEGITGKNMPVEFITDDPVYGTETTEVAYVYDEDGYPIRQYYDGKLVREFSYKKIK